MSYNHKESYTDKMFRSLEAGTFYFIFLALNFEESTTNILRLQK